MNQPKQLFIFHNGNIAVCDEQGHQIPELQKSLITMWAERAVERGCNPEGVEVVGLGLPKLRIFKTDTGWNWGA